jgi:hypothetical protein
VIIVPSTPTAELSIICTTVTVATVAIIYVVVVGRITRIVFCKVMKQPGLTALGMK